MLIAVVIALLPVAALAQGAAGKTDDLLIRVNGPIHVAAGDTARGVAVISDNAVIDGTVKYLVVVNGDATITGTVEQTVTIVNGTVTIKDGARIEKEVLLYRATAVEEPGATVAGGVHNEWGGFRFGRGLLFDVWLSVTVAMLGAGLVFAAAGGKQLAGAAASFTHEVGPTVAAAAVVWIGVPVLAVVLMATVLGIPLGLGILLFFLPALGFAGYLVAGAAVGSLILKARAGAEAAHPYLGVTLGLLILQVIVLVPFVGGMIAFVAGAAGAGALVYRAWLGWRGTPAPRPLPTPTAPAAPVG